ncbi:chemotaxis protein CheW [bacterium]|nr:chemotaxis protein CheW [bacterium]
MNDAELLRKRARLLAEARNEDESVKLEVLLFALNSQHLAVDKARVENVLRLQSQSLTPLPGCPGCIAGLINFSGELLPLVRGNHLLFGITEPSRPETTIVVLKAGDENYGLLVDEIVGIRQIPCNQLLLPSRQNLSPWIASVTRDDITLIDVDALLTHQNLGFGESGT